MKWLRWTIGLGLVIIYFFIAKSYIPKWKSEELLWRNVLSQYPESSVANYNLGTYYMMSLNDIDRAFPYFSKAVQLNDKNITAWINLAAVISGKRGDIQTAKNCIITAAALDSTLPDLLKRTGLYSVQFREMPILPWPISIAILIKCRWMGKCITTREC
ncbi:MAG: hypothetical protein U0T81_00775 [Saprospiraceae bacterium]